MKNRAYRWLWLDEVRNQVHNKTLSSHAGHLALALAVHYTNGSRRAWPSQSTLANSTGYSKRTVQRAIDELTQNGLLTIIRGSPAYTSGNVYQLQNPHGPSRSNASHSHY